MTSYALQLFLALCCIVGAFAMAFWMDRKP